MKIIFRCCWIIIFYSFFVPIGFADTDPLNPEERAWLSEHDNQIILGAEAGWPPITFFNENDDFMGIGVDYLRLIEHRLGFRFKIKKMANLQEILDKARHHQVDVIMNVMSTPERSQYLKFTKPYLEVPTVILTRSSFAGTPTLAKMAGKQVAVPSGFAVIEYIKTTYPKLHLVYVPDSAEGLRRLSTGEYDAMISGLPAASYITEKEGLTNLRVAGFTGHEYNMGIGSRKDLPFLNSILGKGLALISPSERDAIYRKWVHLKYQPFYRNKKFIVVVGIGIGIILLLFSTILIWSRTLKRLVLARTQDLQKELSRRRQAEAALLESEDILRGTLNSTADGILVVGSQGEILTTNHRFAEMWNLPQDVLISGTDQALIEYVLNQLEDPDAFRTRIEELYKTSEESYEEIRLKDGRVFERYSCPLIRDEQEICRVWNFRDVSEHKRAEEELKRLGMAIEQSTEMVMITDPEGTITYVNPAFEKTIGYSRSEIVGQNPRILNSETQNKAFYRDLWATISEGNTWIGQFVNKKKDGSRYTDDTTISPLLDPNGNIISFVAVKRDISDKLKLEEQLIQNQKMEAIGTLAGGIAHDFNNILSVILGYSDMIKEGLLPEDPNTKKINAVVKAGVRAKDLVSQILAFSRQSNKEFKSIQPHLIIKEALKMLRATIPTTIEIHQDVPDCGFIMGDPTQLHQIIMNLCTNAYYAMRETAGVLGVSLTVKELEEQDVEFLSMLSSPGSYMKLEINDTGHGIKKEILKTIFVPYFTTKKKGEGTGLGLSVVHGIVKNFQGQISVYSEPDIGTTFCIYLPKISSKTELSNEKLPKPLPTGKEHILIVDDEVPIVEMEKEMLESLGYLVTACTSSPEALKIFQDHPESFSLVLTDMTMPDMNGVELMQKLRAIRQDTCIVLCTGFSEMINHEKAKHLGVHAYLMKPVLKRELATIVRGILDEDMKFV